jgi:hypothetical protein
MMRDGGILQGQIQDFWNGGATSEKGHTPLLRAGGSLGGVGVTLYYGSMGGGWGSLSIITIHHVYSH